MANYPKELTEFIDQYLTDGVLTEKERNVLLKKAEALGLDRDEVDLYLDAEIQKIEMQSDAARRKEKGKLCPFCETPIPMFTDKCPECGNSITPEATKELNEIIEKLEEALIDFKDSYDMVRSKAQAERYIRKAELYYENNPKVQKLLAIVKSEMIKSEKLYLSTQKKEKKRNRRKKILTSKLFWWLLIMAIGGILILTGDEALMAAGGTVCGVASFVGLYVGAFHLSNSDERRAERERKEKWEHEERMAKINAGQRLRD